MNAPANFKRPVKIKLKDPECVVEFTSRKSCTVNTKDAPLSDHDNRRAIQLATALLDEKLEQRRQGKRNREAGNAFMRKIANHLKRWWTHARRGLQSRDGSEFADIEGTDWWVECKWVKKPSLFGTHDQCVQAQTSTTVGKGKEKQLVPRENPDTRPRLIVLKRFDDGVTYWCCEEEQFLELLQAKADLEKLLELGYEVPR